MSKATNVILKGANCCILIAGVLALGHLSAVCKYAPNSQLTELGFSSEECCVISGLKYMRIALKDTAKFLLKCL